MGNEDEDEPEKKKRQLNPVSSSPMARSANAPLSPDGKTVDAAVLQSQNQKLRQQLEAQKSEMHALERKFKELKEKQDSYDETLITVNRLWNQLVDDLVLLRLLAGGDSSGLQALDNADLSRGMIPSCAPEDTFLCRLLQTDSIEKSEGNGAIKYVQEALAKRHSSTMDLLKHLQETIDDQQAKTERLALAVSGNLSSEDAFIQLRKIESLLRKEADNLGIVINFLHVKHNQYADEVQTYVDSHSRDQSEIERISGELEEGMAELEETRRKLVSLKVQKDGVSISHAQALIAVNGSSSPDKPSEKKTMGLRELKDSIEEAEILADDRLSELKTAQKDNLILSKQLEDLQNKLKDDKYVGFSKPYVILNDKLQCLNTELERYKGVIDNLQADRSHIVRREKELAAKADSADAARSATGISDSKIEDLEQKLQKCITERNDVEIKLEEVQQDSGRKDIKDEIRVMASALSKEMEMMEAQLNRCKEAACEAISLREEARSMRAILDSKTSEHKSLSDRCAERMVEIKSLKELIEKLEKEKQELQFFLDMYGQECFENRTVMEIKESEHRAQAQSDILRTALDEHSLELRVKAANEAEAACQQRLSAAESEIADLRAKLDTFEREVLELTESIRVKDAEAEAYISEIETIGQAYEDMQTQNQHLLQQVTERDDYNIKLVSESVKMKQVHSSLLSEKQVKAKQLQQVVSSIELLKTKITHSEDQMKSLLAQAGKASLANRHLAINTDKTKLELMEAEKDLKWLRSAFDSSEKELEQNQQKADKLRKELEDERKLGERLEEEVAKMTSLVEKMSPESEEAAIQKLQDEIKECKAILKCGVCFDRPKEVLITKCFHLFCSPCIQRNLEIRHRKCPACGTPFGQSDVREVNI